MRILELTLDAPAARIEALQRFYAAGLGLPVEPGGEGLRLRAGGTAIAFRGIRPAAGEPCYHFALRAPRNRFEAAKEWLEARAGLLPDRETGETTFDFSDWNALACYAQDPCGSIVEVIAHRDLPEESSATGPFGAAELLGVCEIGIVVDSTRQAADDLERAGIALWDGSADGGRSLAFMGGRDGTLILAPAGRGWLPTGRAAEPHRVEAVLAGPADRDILLAGTPHHVQISAAG